MTSSNLFTDLEADAARWVLRRRGGVLDGETQRQFERWLSAAAGNRAAYERAEALWEQLRDTEAPRVPVVPRRRWLLAALATCGAAVAWSFAGDPVPAAGGPLETTYRTLIGERRDWQLSAGARLDLDTDSAVQIRTTPAQIDIVLLRGRMLLGVTSELPGCTVSVGQLRAGCRRGVFEIGQRLDGIGIAVADGTLEVVGRHGLAPLGLRAGQRRIWARNGEPGALESVLPGEVGLWRQGRLVFHARPLAEVVEELGRYHEARIAIASPGLQQLPVSGIFATSNLAQTMNTLALTLPVRVARTSELGWRIERR